jgi:hypothetical protein
MHDAGISLCIGRVLATVPYTNSYFVDVPAQGRITATSGEQGSADRRGSTGGGASYLPGALVVIIAPEAGVEGSLGQATPNIILCAFAPFPKTWDTEFYPQAFTEHESDYNNSQVYDTIIDSDYEKTLRQDRSFNRLLDALPGDWTKTNALGAICQISMFLTRIGAGPDCMMQFHGIDRTAELTADTFIRDSASFLERIAKEGRYSLALEQMAHTDFEGLGGIVTDVFTQDDDPGLDLVEEQQRGLMRQASLKGGAVEGELSFTQTASGTSDKKVHAYDDGRSRAGLSRVMHRADGIVRIEAAKEIGLYKTGSIRVPQQTRDVGSLHEESVAETPDPYVGLTDTAAKMEALGIGSEEEYYAVKSLMGDRIKTFEEEDYFWRGLRQEGGIWVVPEKGTTDTEVAPEGSDPTLSSVDATSPEYDFESMASLLTEAIEVTPGRKVKFFKNSSAFIMSEEGGISIGDGHGASIKMEKGVLTLGSALDIKIQPGRNLVTVVPGNEIKKVGGSFELAANGSGVSIKSEGDLHMLSGNGGEGSTILENKAIKNKIHAATEETLEQGTARGGGIYIKSPDSHVSVLASSFTVAGHSKQLGDNDKGIERRSTPCEISIDSGSAGLLMSGSYGSLLFDNQAVLGNSRTSSGVYIDSNTVMTIAEGRVQLTSPQVAIESGSGSVTRSQLSAEGVRDNISLRLPKSDPTLILNGSLLASGTLSSKGSIATQGKVSSNLGANPLPLPKSQQFPVVVPAPQKSATRSKVSEHANNVKGILKSLVKGGIQTDKAHTYSSFCFPSSTSNIYNVDPAQVYFTELPWQRMLRNNSSKWIEKSVEHGILKDTYPYPGKQVFEDKAPIIRALDAAGESVVGKSFDEYITNV